MAIQPKMASLIHSDRPPCYCDQCLRQTAVADQTIARVQQVLAIIDEIEQAIACEVVE